LTDWGRNPKRTLKMLEKLGFYVYALADLATNKVFLY
jgi:hypothetical protein